MCVPTSLSFLVEPRVLQSAEVGPFFSSDGSMLLSEELTDLLEEAPRVNREREGSSEVLWCVSADDPRCSPRDSVPNDGPGSLDSAQLAMTGSGRPRLGPPPQDALRPRTAVRGARPGVRDRVERPPSR